jgi:hypothetical protein
MYGHGDDLPGNLKKSANYSASEYDGFTILSMECCFGLWANRPKRKNLAGLP